MVYGGRYEARLWLCNTISTIHSITPRKQRDLFLELLRLRKSKHDVAPQLLQMIFENKPEKAGSIIANKCYMLEKFFDGHRKRILDWFDHFASVGESGHKKGARALSKFAFMNRDTCWEELDWKGKHGQSPAVVATKPHYFHDLDVLQTVENFLEYVPGFGVQMNSLNLSKMIDEKYFISKFLQLMYEESMEDVWTVIEEFLMNEPFSFLCQRLLVNLDDSRMLMFLKSITKFIHVNSQCKELKYPSCWLEGLLSSCSSSISVDELILLNAVITHGRQLLRILTDEEHEEEKEKMEKLLMSASRFCDEDHWAFMEECMEVKKHISVKWIGLQSWIIQYQITMECKTQQSCESLFSENGISFHREDGFGLLLSNEIVEEGGSEIDEDLDRWRHYSRKRDKKRKTKKYNRANLNADELLEFKPSSSLEDWKLGGRSWRLSTDNYSSAWNAFVGIGYLENRQLRYELIRIFFNVNSCIFRKFFGEILKFMSFGAMQADLPEHLSKHCFSIWMKWIISRGKAKLFEGIEQKFLRTMISSQMNQKLDGWCAEHEDAEFEVIKLKFKMFGPAIAPAEIAAIPRPGSRALPPTIAGSNELVFAEH
ncbi:hypothetical protein KSP40_PGU013748 [Platanthera guangdongensis]|uniref:Uncharacterized protein n=1 Tax=Platanthera guangdongensis TaxID=2320717 RepID=A0ABR2MAK1_9ASPA